jgi:pimeloyl-ACP methyl ester carboxylesterase/ketosteroid isomerase-like protein
MRAMRFAAALFLALLLATHSRAADPVEEVRQAEIGFARAFAERDAAKFFAYVLDDATFMGGGNTLRGKRAVTAQWSRLLAGPEAPFSWGPERVIVNGAGTIGLSTGPIVDPAGNHVGNYNSVWHKQADGSWKVLFDYGSPAACLVEYAAKVEEGFVTADDGAKLYYRKIGNAPRTLIVPLDFALHDDFRRFADVATVITYDLRNRGKSPRAENVNTLTIQRDVNDLEAVRRHFNVDKFVPIGYSYLGAMVAMYALEHPARVSRLVQLAPLSFRGGAYQYPKELTHGMDDMGVAPETLAQWQEARKSDMRAKSPREFCELEWSVFQFMMVGDPKHAKRFEKPCALENEWPVNFGRHMEHHGASLRPQLIAEGDLAKITMPVLTIHGTFDRNAPYGAGRDWAAKLPNARLITVPQAAHAIWLDDPVTVFGAIREFLRGDWPGAAVAVR